MKGFFKKNDIGEGTIKPIIIPRAAHSISRHAINPNALKVLYHLHKAGYTAYLVGGCVRDLLLNLKPKDFDVATNASPEEVRKLFKNCRLIGRRFRLAHIYFGKEIIEVATFRTHHDNAEEQHGKTHQGMIIRDNVYGNIEDDAIRRDFRINALYYNIADFSVIDYVGGIQDIKNRILHMIGDPEKRFHEDPVRLLRAIRFMAKLNFQITPETEEPLKRLSHLLHQVSSARLFQEVLKIFKGGAILPTMLLLQDYKLFSQLFPLTTNALENTESKKFLHQAFKNTDQRIHEGKTVSPPFLFAALLWYPVLNALKHGSTHASHNLLAYEQALLHVIKEQTKRLAIPRFMQMIIREICLLQYRFTQLKGSQPFRLLEHPRFRAGYDLLLLRAENDENAKQLAEWWTTFYHANHQKREEMLKKINPSFPKKRKSRYFKKKVKSPSLPE